MPYKSEAQRKYFNANREKLEGQGVDVDEWNEASKGKKLPEKVKDKEEEKKAFVRSLINYFLKPKNVKDKNLKKEKTNEGNETVIDEKQKNTMQKQAIGILEALGALGGAAAGAAHTPEVTSSNNPILNRIRGDVYPKENARIQAALRGALAGLTGVVGGRAGLAAGTLLGKSPLIANKLVSPGTQKLIQNVLSPAGAIAGGGAGGAAGMGVYDLLKRISDKSQNLAKAEKKGYQLSFAEKKAFIDLVKAARCWQGYEAVPGKKAYSDGSCRPVGGKEKKEKEKKADCLHNQNNGRETKCEECGEVNCNCKQASVIEQLGRLLAIKQAEERGLWANIHAKRKRGEKPAKPGDQDYPDQKSWNKTVKSSGDAWQRAEGKNPEGGLNAKGRASLKAEGQNIKPPVTEDKPTGERAGRKASFCARMGGMKKKLTSSETASDPDSRINKALRKWNC
jgi:hypothetical protein